MPIEDELFGEAMGVLCGLPPGTVSAAQGMMGLVAGGSTAEAAKKQASKNTRNTSKKEEKVIKFAIANLADTAKKDHPRIHIKRCIQYAFNVLVVASKIYSDQVMKKILLNAVRPSHTSCRKVMIKVSNDYKGRL